MKPSFVRIFDPVCIVKDRREYQKQGEELEEVYRKNHRRQGEERDFKVKYKSLKSMGTKLTCCLLC